MLHLQLAPNCCPTATQLQPIASHLHLPVLSTEVCIVLEPIDTCVPVQSLLHCVGGDAEHTAKEMIFEAQSQLNKQQQAQHGGAVRGTDAARVQVLLFVLLSPSFIYCSCAMQVIQNEGQSVSRV